MNLVTAAFTRFAHVRTRGPLPAARGRTAPAHEPPRGVQLGVERSRLIRQRAEDAALAVATGRAAGERNPFQRGTREHVLWSTSFHAKLMEFETEAFAPAPAVACFERPEPRHVAATVLGSPGSA